MPTRTPVFVTEYFYRGVWHSSVGCRFFCAERINIWVGALTRVREKKKKRKNPDQDERRGATAAGKEGRLTRNTHKLLCWLVPRTGLRTLSEQAVAVNTPGGMRRTPTTSPSERHVYLGQRRTDKDVLFLFWLTYTSAWKYTPLALLFRHISCVRAIYVCKIVAARRPPRLSSQQRWIVARRQ